MTFSLKSMSAGEFRAAQHSLGYSGHKLAKLLAVAPNTVYRWRSGLNPIPVLVAYRLRCLLEH